MTVCNQNRIKCSNLEVRLEECSNGTATDCSSLTQLETIWNMTQCGRKILSGSNAAEGGTSGVSDGKTGDSGSASSGSNVVSGNNAKEEEASDESKSQGSSSESTTTASNTNGVVQNSLGTQVGRGKRQVLGSNSGGSFGFSSGGSFGSNSFRNQQPAAVDAEYEFLATYMGLPEHERQAIGHDFKGMFKSCTFEGVNCLDKR